MGSVGPGVGLKQKTNGGGNPERMQQGDGGVRGKEETHMNRE